MEFGECFATVFRFSTQPGLAEYRPGLENEVVGRACAIHVMQCLVCAQLLPVLEKGGAQDIKEPAR